MKGKTKSGFEFELDKKALDDMELVDALVELEESGGVNPLAMARVTLLLLGKEQKKRLYDHLRAEDGRVPVAAVYTDVTEIFTTFGQGKN